MDLEESQQILEQMKNIMIEVKDSTSSIAQSIATTFKFITDASGGFSNLSGNAKEAATNVQNLTGKLQGFGSYILNVDENTKKFFSAIMSGSKESADSIGQIHGAFLAAGGAVGSLMPISSVFKTIGGEATIAGEMIDGNLLSVLTQLGIKAPVAMLQHAESAKRAETNLMGLHARAGNLTSAFGSLSTDINTLNNLTDEFADRMLNVGNATGLVSSEVSKYAQQLLQIPGAYGKMEETPVGSMDLLSAAITVARGTTQDFKDVFEVLNQQFKLFGQVGQEPLELMSRMFQVSQSLGMPLNYIQDQIKQTATQFKFFGDNTEAALRIFQGFGPALQRSGVGPEGIREIIGNLTTGVEKLDLAQKAFISAQTGGPGGLQGAFEIDLLLQQGKMDEVFNRMQQTLMKQFGKITTLEEAARDPNAAQNLTRQVAFLRQGPFGNLVQSDAQAYKLLEAFKSGAAPDMSKFNDGQMALSDTMQRGTQIQERQTTHLATMSNILNRISSAVGDINARVGRENFGTQGASGQDLLNTMKEARDMTAQENPQIKGSEAAIAGAAASAVDVFKNVKESFESFMQEASKEPEKPKTLDIEPVIDPFEKKSAPPVYFEPINIPENINIPTSAKPIEKITPQINPNELSRAERMELINREKERINEIQHGPTGQNMQEPSDQTILIKVQGELDGRIKEEVVASVVGKIKRIERNEASQGFSIDVG